jgi:hypothetical protein
MKTTMNTAVLALALLAAGIPSNDLAGDPSAAQPVVSPLTQLKADAKSAGDPQLQSLSGDLGSKVQSLTKLLGNNADAKGQVQTALQSMLGGKSVGSLNALQKLSQAKLTPDQTKLAKEVKDVGSAYLVQKNLGTLEGSQSDVAQVVSSLRKGETATALPAIKRVSQNAKLTDPQKDFLKSLANHYAPGVGKAQESLNKLKSLPGLGN